MLTNPYAHPVSQQNRIAGVVLAIGIWLLGRAVRYILAGPRSTKPPPPVDWGIKPDGSITWRRWIGTADEWRYMFASFAMVVMAFGSPIFLPLAAFGPPALAVMYLPASQWHLGLAGGVYCFAFYVKGLRALMHRTAPTLLKPIPALDSYGAE